jgi:hypothetical protein
MACDSASVVTPDTRAANEKSGRPPPFPRGPSPFACDPIPISAAVAKLSCATTTVRSDQPWVVGNIFLDDPGAGRGSAVFKNTIDRPRRRSQRCRSAIRRLRRVNRNSLIFS